MGQKIALNVHQGDLITQETDVIVVCSSSEYLFNAICKAGGSSVKTSFDTQTKRNSEASVIAVKADGQLASKIIYFLPWKGSTDATALRKSIEKFVSDAVDKAVAEKWQSIAFPAIGCGQFGCSISLVAQTMVGEAHRKSKHTAISVSFVIQPERTDIYEEFQKQIHKLEPVQPPKSMPPSPSPLISLASAPPSPPSRRRSPPSSPLSRQWSPPSSPSSRSLSSSPSPPSRRRSPPSSPLPRSLSPFSSPPSRRRSPPSRPLLRRRSPPSSPSSRRRVSSSRVSVVRLSPSSSPHPRRRLTSSRSKLEEHVAPMRLPSPSTEQMKTIAVAVNKGTIVVQKGDITTEKVDAIIASSSSEVLKRAIIKVAGNEVQIAYNTEYKNNSNALLISTPPGTLPCQRIFFVNWVPSKDEAILRQSIIDLMSTVVQNVIMYKFTSLAFPAIGCGQHGCSVDVVIKTMVKEMKNQLTARNSSLTVKFVIQPDQQNIYDAFCKQVLAAQDDNHESTNCQLPKTWAKSKGKKIRFELSNTSDEYKSILTNFDQAMKGKYTQLIRIERIQNERWYIQYWAHSRNFKLRLDKDTEKCLYHGCPEQAAGSIMEDCFNRSFAGVNGTVYGFGVYFSSNAAYSHGYTKPNTNGERNMFLARVLVGNTTIGDQSMKTRPHGFDSTTDGNHIFVTYHDAQAYADYLITYKTA